MSLEVCPMTNEMPGCAVTHLLRPSQPWVKLKLGISSSILLFFVAATLAFTHPSCQVAAVLQIFCIHRLNKGKTKLMLLVKEAASVWPSAL